VKKKMVAGCGAKGMKGLTLLIPELIQGKIYKILVGEYSTKRLIHKPTPFIYHYASIYNKNQGNIAK
jgi:hypothetical protein